MQLTKFNDDFVKEVQDFYNEGKKQKKSGYKRDQSFTAQMVADKFNLTLAQVKRMLYVRSKNDT
tara:strand:- start:572 stop:763 length:192 start_codon:yes stop_codon:yes gene_type:complete